MKTTFSRYIIVLCLGLFFGYSVFQFVYTINQLQYPYGSDPDFVYIKKYAYTGNFPDESFESVRIILQTYREWDWGALWYYRFPEKSIFFNFTLVNQKDEIQWISLPDDYFDVSIFKEDELVYSLRSGLEVNESERVFLAPLGKYSVYIPWGGIVKSTNFSGYLPTGNYSVVGFFRFNTKEIRFEGVNLEVKMVKTTPSRTV